MTTNEENSLEKSISPDAEFEGNGGHEEGIFSEWKQKPKSKWDTGELEDL